MTFLYDSVIHEKPVVKQHVSKYDLSAIRQQTQDNNVAPATKQVDIAETLIPEEYKVIVNQGVAPLKIEKT